MKITDAGARSAPPPPQSGAAEPRAASSFDALLALSSQARTAPAEGPKKTTERRDTAAQSKTDSPAAEQQADAAREQGLPVDAPVADEARAEDQAPVQAPDAAAELAAAAPQLVPVPVPGLVVSPAAPAVAPIVQADVEIAPQSAPTLAQAGQAVPAGSTPSDVEAGAGVPAPVEAGAPAQRPDLPSALMGLAERRGPEGVPAPPLPAAPAVPASEITPATSAAPVADAAAADATDLPAAPAHAGKAPADGAAPQRAFDQQATPQAGGQATAQSGQQQPDGQPPSQPAAAAHAEGQVAPAATDRPASAAPAPDAAAPVAQAESMATPQATSPAAPVRAEHVQGGLQLAQTVERLREMVQIATRNGAAHARLQLHPVELGAVEVRLKASTDGVTAKIIADRPEAVEALQQAGADLRRSLEDRGVTVLDVEISLSASAGDDPGAHNAAHAGSQNGLTSETTTNRRGRDAASEPTSETDELSESARAPRADSGAVLVDVLA